MERFFHNELEEFRTNLVLMGEKSIAQVRLALRALFELDPKLAHEVHAKDDEIDDLEVTIDNEAIRYINLRQPVASELRLLAVGMKAANDLERVGDEATSIAKRATRLAADLPVKDFKSVPQMADTAVTMLHDTLECLLNEDETLALKVCHRDRQVDEWNRQNFDEWKARMIQQPDEISRILELILISKSLERVADHATNIAEEIVFLLRGEDVRHTEEVKKYT